MQIRPKMHVFFPNKILSNTFNKKSPSLTKKITLKNQSNNAANIKFKVMLTLKNPAYFKYKH